MAKINPRKDGSISDSGSRPKKVTAGNKIFAPIGIAYTKSANKGTVCLHVYSIVIKDLEGDNNEGIIHIEKFWQTGKALWKVANFALSMRCEIEFDSEDRNDVEKMIANGVCFSGEIAVKDSGEYTVREIVNFNIPSDVIDDGKLKLTPEMEEYIVQGEQAFPKYIQKQKEYGVNFIEPKSSVKIDLSSDEEEEYQHDSIPF